MIGQSMRRCLPLILLTLASSGFLDACGASSKISSATVRRIRASIVRPQHPVWCPRRIGGSSSPEGKGFDVRSLLGELEQAAASMTIGSGCSWQVVERNGHGFNVTADLVFNRVDATVKDGVVIGVDVG